ncbi:MAG: hypothetical protein KGH56_03620 [Patescibacteria group bacterium]|nr:hypothetical protein [Patescibacteria group bacterium]
MSRASTLILLGILTILTPFSGLPSSFRSLLAVIFGASVFAIGFSLRAREAESAQAATTEPAPPTEVSPI